MYIKRITFRIPRDLYTKVKILANQNCISFNKQLIELVAFGIRAFLEKAQETTVLKDEGLQNE